MNNLLDIVENVLRSRDLNYSRLDENELVASLSENYSLSIMLRPDCELLHFSNDMDLICTDDRLAVVEDSIIKANERIWLGHFDLLSNGNRIVHSFTLPFLSSFLLEEANFEMLIDLICTESDKFYHYFCMVINGENIPDFSISSLFQDSVGEA